ncbi:MAG: MFS transporter [Candidatus Sumerlaeaceae bacterium]|nr:MFS transporter [Candidatus Sumerlaeaceae bacterium]
MFADYIKFLRRNRDFRRLWYGSTISQLGDWFDSIALYILVLKLTGSPTATAGLIVVQLLPGTFVAPFAGVVVDRLPRKAIMIASDLLRAALVLCFLFVRSAETVWIVYPIMALKVSVSSFFEPARSSVVPSIVPREELVISNIISGLTWSIMLSIGAAIGGLITHWFGPYIAIVLDAATFVGSAFCIATVRVPREVRPTTQKSSYHDLLDGARFLRRHTGIMVYALIKSGWGFVGGAMLLLPLIGRDIFPWGHEGALSVGALMAARGVGTAIGPVVAHRIGGNSYQFLRRAIGPAMVVGALGYMCIGLAPNLPLAVMAVVFAHIGGATVWVFSTVLLQMVTPDAFRGRVFATEMASFTLTMAISVWIMGIVTDHLLKPQSAAIALGFVMLFPAMFIWPLMANIHLARRTHHEPITEPGESA